MRRNLTFRGADDLLFHRVVVAVAMLAIAILGTVGVANAQNLGGTPADSGRQFRYSVMIDGDVAVAGAEWHDGFKGAAYVLRRRGTEWVVEQQLSPGDLGPYDHFGGSTSIGGDYIVVGAAWHGTFRGAAYVFKRVGGEWIQQQKLMASDAAPDGQFGKVVSVDGDMITVGAGFGDTRAVRAKTMYRFTRSGDRWDERERFTEPNLDKTTLQHEESLLNSAVVSSLLASGLIDAGAEIPALPTAPPPPVDTVLATNGTLEDRVEVRWPSVGLDAIVYKVLRNGVLLSIVASDDSLYIDTTGELNTTYSYCVVVKDMAEQESPPTCADGRRIIFPPTSVTATDGEFVDRVAISWVDMSNIEDGYYIYRDGARIDSTGANESWVDDTTGLPDSMYNYEVRAFAEGEQSAAVSDSGWRGVVLPPVNVSASDGEYGDRVVITWEDQTDVELGYRVYRDSVLIGTTAANETRFEDTGIVFGVTYTYCVATVKDGTIDAIESIWVCDEGGTGLTPPANVSASDSTYDDRITITWDDLCPNEDGYEIARALTPDTVVLDTTRANVEVYHDFTADSNITYTYFVRAVNDSGGVSAAVADDGFMSIVLAPTNIEATDGTFEDHVDITWESQSKTAVLFKIYRDGAFIKSLSVGYNSYSDYGGTAGQVYDYTVVASTALEAEAWGLPDEGSRELGTPSAVAASDEEYEDKIVISWVDNSQLEHGYVVSRRDTSAADDDTTFVIGPNRRSYTDYNAVPDVIYRYTVSAFDSASGAVGYSAPAEDLGLRVLLAPSGVQASDGEFEEQIELFWQDNSNAEDGYRIYRDDVLIGETADNFTTYIDTSPHQGETHLYSVAAYDSVIPPQMGESERVSDSGYTTILAPVSFNASDFYEDRIELTWVDVSNVETAYEIWRDSGPSTSMAFLASTGPNVTRYTDFPLEQGIPYRYCIKALGNSTLVSTEECDEGSRFLAADIETVELSLKLQQSDALPGDKYGIAVAVSGDAAIIGANEEDNERGTNAGAAYIFERDASGIWRRKQKLIANDGEPSDRFGYEVAISGDVAVIGVPNDDNPVWDQGSVYIWERNTTTGDWDYIDKLSPTGVAHAYFGHAVAVSGDLLVVGAFWDSPPTHSGAAYVYRRQSNGAWTFEKKLTAPDAAEYDRFGRSVAISGDALIIGASEDDNEQGTNAGAAYIFKYRGGQDWIPEQKLIAQDAASSGSDIFGESVAISGDVALIGAPGNDEMAPNAGAVYIFEFDNVDTWKQTYKLVSSDGSTEDQFGFSAAMRGGVAVIGAIGDDSHTGSAYIFSMDPNTGDWRQTGKVTSSEGDAYGDFGYSVSFSGDVALVGAPHHNVSTGAAYVLEMPSSPVAVSATDGTFDSRVRVTWDDVSSNEDGFRVYRDSEPVATVEENAEVYEDFDAEPGRTYEYSVAAFWGDVSVELERVSDFGWRPPNGNITGRISAVGGGASEGIFVGLDPPPTKALLLDGAGGHVHVADPEGDFSFTTEDDYTVEAWFKYVGNGGSGSGDGTLIAKVTAHESGPKQYPFWLSNMRGAGDPGRLNFAMSDGVKTVGVSTHNTDLNDNSWHHVACVHDAEKGEIRIYVDGDLQGVTPYAGLADITNSDSLSLGSGATPESWFGGQLDEIRIWNVVCEATQIRDLMYKQLTGEEVGLVAYWPLDEGSSGVITDPYFTGHYGVFAGGVYWTDNSAPLDIYAQTGPSGNYVLADLHYGNATTFKVRPFEGKRQFEPAFSMITLSVDHPVENQVNFSDISSYTLSGVVMYENTDCAASDVPIVVDGLMGGTTDKNGKFSISVDNGEHSIKPSLEGHSFTPDSLTFLVEDDIEGILFTDTTTRTLSGYVGGGCGRRIGDVIISIRSENNCLTESITADSAYSISLPPQRYLVSAAVVESSIPVGLIKSDVIRFFQNLGERQADLDSTDVTMDMTYRAPLTVSIEGLDAYIPTDCPGPLTFEGQALPENLPVIPQLTVLDLVINVDEDYGSGGHCPLDSGIVVIYDEIFDREGIPIELEVRDGEVSYTTFASTPSLVVGRVDSEGNDRSFQKVIRAMAVVEGRQQVTAEEWVLVTGHVAQEGADFVTATSELPLYILRDPPGDRSYAFLEKGHTLRENIYYDKYIFNWQNGVKVRIEVGFDAAFFFGLGAGTIEHVDFAHRSETSFLYGQMEHGVSRTDLTFTTKRRIATSSDELFVGEEADVFVGAGLNYIFSETEYVDVTDCEVHRFSGVGFEPDSIVTMYAYTQRYIEDVLIRELQSKVNYYEQLDPDSADMFRAMCEYWQYLVAKNASLKLESAGIENRSFSGGTEYSYLLKADTTKSFNWSQSFVWELGTDLAGFGWSNKFGSFLINFPVLVHREDVEAEDYIDSTGTVSKSVGFVLSDDNIGDRFTVDVKQDGIYPSPVFDVLAGVSSCPYEAWPDLETGEARVMSRDKPRLFIDPPALSDVPADEPATFSLSLANLSPTGEARRYALREITTQNPHGALLRANGEFINDDLVYLVEPGQSAEVTLTVERGPTRYNYDNLAVMVYPLCEWWLWERGGPLCLADTVFFDVTFEAPCSDITLFRPEPGWAVSELDPFVEIILTDYELEISEDKTLQSVWGQYRRLGNEHEGPTEWYDIPADSLGHIETIIQWIPPDSLPDGVYELRAYTQCPGGRGYSGVSTGTIDRHAPVVFGTPEPTDEELSFGEDISITFNEPIDCASIDPDRVTLTWLDGPNEGSRIDRETTCNGNTIIIMPTADADLLEGRRLEASVSGIRDGVGNGMEGAVTWAFNYRKSRFAWSNSNPSEEVAFRSPGTVTAELVNGTGTQIDFHVTQMPSWIISAAPEMGTIASGASEVIAFAVLDTIAMGTYADSIFAEGTTDVDTSLAGMFLTLDVSCFPPQWEVKPSDYEHSMTMVAELDIGGTITTDTNDRVAAWVGSQLRGVANVQSVSGLPSTHLAFLTIYSNRSKGETVRFQVWDDDDCRLYNGTLESHPFEANGQIGSPQAPVTLTATDAPIVGDSLLVIDVDEGWTWFSTNILSPDMSVEGVTANLTPAPGDIVKSQSAFTQFVCDSTGWVPPLVLDNVSGYMIRLSQAGTILHSGAKVAVDSVIPVSQGWNWIGYLPEGPIEVTQALADLDAKGIASTNDIVKSQHGFAQYYGGVWYGSLDSMRTGEGYKLHLAAAGDHTFNYPAYVSAPSPPAVIAATSDDEGPVEGAPAWSVNPRAYQYNMTVTSVLRIDGTESSDPSDMIGAFVGDECRGVARPVYVEAIRRYIAFIMIHSNAAGGEGVTFRAFDADADLVYDIEESIACNADAVEGTVLEPIVLHTGSVRENEEKDLPAAFGLAQNFPNPFNPSTVICFDVPAGGGFVTIRIYDVGGRLVRTLVNGLETAGRKSVAWNGRDTRGNMVATGVYFYRMTAPGFERTRKMVLLK